MSETKNPEEIKTVNNIGKIVEKLKESPMLKKDFEEIVNQMDNIAEDLCRFVKSDFKYPFSFHKFLLEIDWENGVKVFAPKSKIQVSFIGTDALMNKTIYQSLIEDFSNKLPKINVLLEEFVNQLDSYVKMLRNILEEIDMEEDP
jgi:hypothetical protein